MICIVPIDSETLRDFTAEESQEMIPLWQKLTKKASDRSLEAASYYGKVDRQDPEWNFLADEVNNIIQDWAAKIRRLGAEPRELWTIPWNEDGQERVWQFKPESYALG